RCHRETREADGTEDPSEPMRSDGLLVVNGQRAAAQRSRRPRADAVEPIQTFEKREGIFRRCSGVDGGLKQPPRLFGIPAVKRGNAGLQQLFGLPLALGKRAAGAFDVRAGALMAAVKKQRTRPDVDRLIVLPGEIM